MSSSSPAGLTDRLLGIALKLLVVAIALVLVVELISSIWWALLIGLILTAAVITGVWWWKLRRTW